MDWHRVAELDSAFAKGGRKYRVVIEGERRDDGTWAGRVAFVDGGQARRTGQETSQPNRKALEYWATGLEPVYLDGAFGRAEEEGRS